MLPGQSELYKMYYPKCTIRNVTEAINRLNASAVHKECNEGCKRNCRFNGQFYICPRQQSKQSKNISLKELSLYYKTPIFNPCIFAI